MFEKLLLYCKILSNAAYKTETVYSKCKVGLNTFQADVQKLSISSGKCKTRNYWVKCNIKDMKLRFKLTSWANR